MASAARLTFAACARLITAALLACLAALATARAEQSSAFDIEVFTRRGCPHCAAARNFLEDLKTHRPDLRIAYRAIDQDPDALARLKRLVAASGGAALGVPTFYVQGRLVVGFEHASTTGKQLVQLLDEPAPSTQGAAPICGVKPDDGCEPGVPDQVDTRLFGTLRASRMGLPAFTIALGLLDGFNPCATWVLLFLLSLLVNLHDRKKLALIGGTFVLTSGVVYFGFMAAWLQLFLLVGLTRPLELALGLIALMIATVNIKDFFAFKRGLSLSIPEAAKPDIYERARRVLRAESLIAALFGVAALALLVNLVELLCTAGLPAIYVAVLANRGLSPLEHHAYLLLYNIAYVLDDSVMVSVAVFTLSKRKLTEHAGRWLKLLSGVVMLALGLALLGAPHLLR